jgi:cobalt-zinc-cadmium efflux system outer membrane protein
MNRRFDRKARFLPYVPMQIALSLALVAPSLAAQSPPSKEPRLFSASPDASAVVGAGQTSRQQSEAQKLSGHGLSLDELQQMALTNNPTLGQAQAGVRAAAGLTRQAGLWPNPTIGYVGDEIRGGSFGGGEQGVFVQQNVILGGKLGLDKKVRAEEGKQAEAEAQEQKLRVENGVRVAFYEALAAQRMVEMRKNLNALAQDAVETTRQLFNVGQADQPDVLQAQVEADEADVAVITSRQEQQRAWRVLAAVVGKPDLPLTTLVGNLEDLPTIDSDQMLQTILNNSPAMKIAELGATRAGIIVTRSQREVVPDLSLRAGYMNNLEQLGSVPPKAAGSQGFAEVGINLRLFNRNQGNIEASKADQERATLEVQRVSLVLRQLSAPILQSYTSARAVADRYKTRTLPTARQAYELYLEKYHEGAAAYPQVLIAQRTLFQLETNYIATLEKAWINAAALEGLLLTDGLDLPAGPGELDRPVREINMPVPENPGVYP